ncbi:MAG: hypothetical protein Q9213_001800 [Squamulea squamosa]
MDGYPRLARLMGSNPALAIFRRYGSLNAQNILYMQAEINELEKELQDIAREDRLSEHAERQRYSREWWRLARAQGADSLQWKKCLEVRAKLNEYSCVSPRNAETRLTLRLDSALLNAKEVFSMTAPIEQDIRFLRTWLSRPESGDNFLRGGEASLWGIDNTSDLVALSKRPGEHDVFTNWIANSVLYLFHRYIGHWIDHKTPNDEEAGFTEYNDTKLMAALTLLATLLSSTIPVLSTVVLYFARGMPLRLAMIAVFVTLFCSTLAIFTNARRVEIFAATAA